MNMNVNKCIFGGIGKHPENCDGNCYPSVLAYGLKGDGGFMNTSNIPKKYRNKFLKDLPIKEENPKAYAVINAYINNIIDFVDRGVGLFFYSVPNPENKLGTGTGKTHSASTIANEYIKARIIQHTKGERQIEHQPALFIRVAEFQNTYNKQFRGGFEEQEEATYKFNKMLKRMEETDLLILDDISLRSSTEAMTNILYEVLDERYINEKPVIFTSNFPIQKIGEILNPQIQSRIEGMTEKIAFNGKDHRKGGIL
jgi:DNA replication protein DnaC